MSRASMRGVVPLPYPPPPPGLARGVTNATSVSRPILCTLLGDGGDATTSTSAPPATSTDPGPGCGVCARAVTSVSADGRLMNSGDQSDIRLGQRGTQTTTFLMDVMSTNMRWVLGDALKRCISRSTTSKVATVIELLLASISSVFYGFP
ncbi:uncharacterized protein LOC111635010 isoform X1 [Centruroides sculpturatus]|uniref:uncharacterized protein LOC111635010 isoform X1 n=1 Tax=Centruroides sculpturatus TaxID=218467 RepID=UPI000C6D5A65|nr:uncharacterized protein LOC111635010 isoform X1 [Centruroides sculpturatus]